MHQQSSPNSGNITDVPKFNSSLSHLVPMKFMLSKLCSISRAVDFAATRFDGPWGSRMRFQPCCTESQLRRLFFRAPPTAQPCVISGLSSTFFSVTESDATSDGYYRPSHMPVAIHMLLLPLFCYGCSLRLSLAHYYCTSERSWVVIDRSYQFITR